MKTPLRILCLEDNPNDVTLLATALDEAKIDTTIRPVGNRTDFIAAIKDEEIDLVIADYTLPGFDGLAALKLTRARQPNLPFILLSGTVDDELAIQLLENGATDYVLKEHLSKLGPAVRRIVKEIEKGEDCERLERQFIQAQKMEVVGRLSSGVAHDFNNILGIIMGNNDYVIAHLEEGHPLRPNLEEIKQATQRAAGLTRQLLIFSRNQAVQTIPLDLNEVVSSLDKMLYRLAGENVELTIIPSKRSSYIKADLDHVGQVLMNLVVNARDAMPEGGRLAIEIATMVLTKKESSRHPTVPPGDYVTLTVSDTGTGMSKEVKERLFEPFFTTKPTGKGTGLGLTTCLTIIKESEAHIEVESEAGQGTTFRVYFPRVDRPVKMRAVATKIIPLSRGKETLLVVEDEAALRRVMCIVLRSQGYTVLEAANGQEGLRVATEHEETPIDLVVSDIVMPQMGGRMMVECLKATHPRLKVLFTSGYMEEALAESTDLKFLAKPYTLATLTKRVREVLDAVA